MSDTPMTLQQLFMVYRTELGYSFISAIVAVCRHWQLRHPFRDLVTSAIICAAFAFGMKTILDFLGIDGEVWGFIGSVVLGYMGVESLLDYASEKIPFLRKTRKKTEELSENGES